MLRKKRCRRGKYGELGHTIHGVLSWQGAQTQGIAFCDLVCTWNDDGGHDVFPNSGGHTSQCTVARAQRSRCTGQVREKLTVCFGYGVNDLSLSTLARTEVQKWAIFCVAQGHSLVRDTWL